MQKGIAMEEIRILNTILEKSNVDKVDREELLFQIRKNFIYYRKKAEEIMEIGDVKEEKPEDILRCFLILLPNLKKEYNRINIKEDIFYDTISDIFLRCKIYKRENFKLGLTEEDGSWLLRIFDLNIFKIGSLQFEMIRFTLEDHTNIKFNKNFKGEIKVGDKLLSIHIMEGENISPGQVERSLKLGKKFFQEKFKDFNYQYFYCWSWILYSGNKKILNKESNIVRFMDRFEIIGESQDPDMAIERIFRCKKDEIDINRLDTSLQKNAVKNIRNLGMGAGIIKKSKI